MEKELFALKICSLLILTAIVPASASIGDDSAVTITPLVDQKYQIGEDTITFSGTNTASNTTYLLLSGPNLDPKGSQIQKDWPGKYPVIDGDASTFMAVGVGPDNTWSYMWDTHDVLMDSGLYTVYASSAPRDIPHIDSTKSGMVSFPMLPPKDKILPLVKITPLVDQKYYIGEDTITFSGINTASNTTYLLLSGPNLDPKGSQIQKDWPGKNPVIDGDASSFMAVGVGPDNTWSYTWDTHDVFIDSGMYTVYASSTPRDIPHLNSTQSSMVSFPMLPPKGMIQAKEA